MAPITKTSLANAALLIAAGALALVTPSSTAFAEDGAGYNLPFQRLSVGGHVGGMGLAGASLGIGFDPYSQVELEASARMFTGILETQDEFSDPPLTDCGPEGEEGDDVYPCPANAGMFSIGLILGRHNSWDRFNKGLAIRTGLSTLGEIYTSVGARVEGGLSEDHTITWNGELAVGYWFTSPNRAPTDLLALPWNGQYGNTMDALSQSLLLSLRLGVNFYPIR